MPEEPEVEEITTSNEQEPLLDGDQDQERRMSNLLEYDDSDGDDTEIDAGATDEAPAETGPHVDDSAHAIRPPLRRGSQRQRRRRLSTYESADAMMDLEADDVGGSARSLY